MPVPHAGRTCTISRSTIPLRESSFFGDARSARPLVEGTVARGQLHEDALLYTGKATARTRRCSRFRSTTGSWRVVRSGSTFTARRVTGAPDSATGWSSAAATAGRPRITIDRLRSAPVGHFFDVISNGFGAMPDYAAQINVEDRWAIVAYIRALQLSEHATVADVPADQREKLQ